MTKEKFLTDWALILILVRVELLISQKKKKDVLITPLSLFWSKNVCCSFPQKQTEKVLFVSEKT